MELKLRDVVQKKIESMSSNCTFMELKYEGHMVSTSATLF